MKLSTVVTTNQRKKTLERQKCFGWCGAMQFHDFPKEIVILKNARIPIPTTRAFWKYPSARQIPKREANLPSEHFSIFVAEHPPSANSEKHRGPCECAAYCRSSPQHAFLNRGVFIPIRNYFTSSGNRQWTGVAENYANICA